MDSEVVDSGTVAFKDKRTRIVAAGLIQGLMGVVCFLFSLLMLLGLIIAAMAAEDTPMSKSIFWMVMPFLEFILFSVWFLVMGFGSIYVRRWARALSLVVGWMWFVFGSFGFISSCFFLPGMYSQMPMGTDVPAYFPKIMMFSTLGFMGVFMVAIPGMLVLLYSGRNVKATCEHYNPEVCWTDLCPLPVLAVSLFFATWAFFPVATIAFLKFYPFFSFRIEGIPAYILLLIFCVANLYIAREVYKLKPWAWWGVIALILLGHLPFSVSFAFMKPDDYAEIVGVSMQEMEKMGMQNMWMPGSPGMIGLTVFWFVAMIGYLVYVKKFFGKQARGQR